MAENPLSPLQEKMENVAPQQDPEVMALIQRSGRKTQG